MASTPREEEPCIRESDIDRVCPLGAELPHGRKVKALSGSAEERKPQAPDEGEAEDLPCAWWRRAAYYLDRPYNGERADGQVLEKFGGAASHRHRRRR